MTLEEANADRAQYNRDHPNRTPYPMLTELPDNAPKPQRGFWGRPYRTPDLGGEDFANFHSGHGMNR